MQLVEVVRTPTTRATVPDSLTAWILKLGKLPIPVKDSPGFVVNRVLLPYFSKAMQLLRGGMRISLIDEALRRFGMPRGPLEVLDQVGLDVAAAAARSLRPVFGERLPPAEVLEKMQHWVGSESRAALAFTAIAGANRASMTPRKRWPAIQRPAR